LTNYVEHLQPELPANYCNLIYVMVDNQREAREQRDALAATFPFLLDTGRDLVKELDMVDTTDQVHRSICIPYTFVLEHDRTIHKIYNG
jgi:peroxiredoxin